MNRKFWFMALTVFSMALLLGAAATVAHGKAPQDEVLQEEGKLRAAYFPPNAIAARAPYTPTTTLTVDTSEDPDTSPSYTCGGTYTGGFAPAPDGKCTLRRAIVEAGAMSSGSRPILIAFNLATGDSGYNSTLQTWKIALAADLPYVKGGQVIIDGSTQPNGRADGPKIIIHGGSIKLGETQYHDDNQAIGLAIQGGELALVGDNNVAENNWVGLTDDGQGVYYIDGIPNRSNYSYIRVGGDNNVVRANASASANGVSIVIEGDDNLIVDNTVGTRADGTLPDVPENRKCHANAFLYNWFTGDGLHVRGYRNQVDNNVIAGMLFASNDPFTTPPEAIEISGFDHIIRNNKIGVDANGQERWVCGAGITLDGKRHQIVNNAIVNTRLPAIGIYGSSYSLDAITMQGNVIKNAPKALDFGPNVPSAWKNFTPAQVTSIDGTSVSGTAGEGSACANCVVELFIDDGDELVEALQALTRVTADASGAWMADIGATLAPTQGLRTASTTSASGQISGFSAGTTSKFSALYPDGVQAPPLPPTPTLVPPSLPVPTPPATPQPPASYVTVLTVNTTEDPDTSPSYTCYKDYYGPPAPAPDGKCTLRRAIIEANAQDVISRPVQIVFNIPLTDTGYNAALGTWKITLKGDLAYVKGGGVTIDGSTQPGGRANGPKIIIHGGSIKLGEIAGEDDNIARSLLVQEGSIRAINNGNIIENNWVGLSGDGQTIHYINDNPDQSNYSYIRLGGDNNVVRDNASASADGVSFVVDGDYNVLVRNTAGTRADGTLPEVPANRKCKPNAVFYTWFTGDGMHISGDHNWVGSPDPADGNIIAGMLFASADVNVTPPEAIEIHGEYNVMQNNKIGLDSAGLEVGACGMGVYVDNRFNYILDNTFVKTGQAAIGIYGSTLLNAITLRGNTLKDVPGAVEFGPLVPPTWVNFKAAQVTGFAGTTVNGTSGAASACPYCTVELFIDDGDDKIEALAPVMTTTADADGNWSVDIGMTLAPTQGLRTASTTSDYGVIENFEGGTTSDFSQELYSESGSVQPPPPPTTPTVAPPPFPTPVWLPAPTAPVTYATILTVTTTNDPDTSPSYTCVLDPLGPDGPAPDKACTLRRAIVEASSMYTPRPVLIRFNIPLTDTGHNATLDTWKFTLLGDLPYVSEGQVVIDGRTQPGGRATGPKLIVRGGSIKLGEIAGDDNNAVYGFAVQEGSIRLITDRNIAENNWVGLSDDGQTIHYINDDPDRDNYSYIRLGGDNNMVRNNASASAQGVSFVIDGDDNILVANSAGTRADGTAPEIAANRKCKADAFYYNWFTGDGIHVYGSRNQVGGPNPADGNVIAGLLFASRDPDVTPPDAIEVSGEYNLVQNNKIGLDSAGHEVGTCGLGIYVNNRFNQLLDNTIVKTGSYALGIFGSDLLNAITWQGNTLKDVPAAVEFGPLVPEAWVNFKPAQITGMTGSTVNGTSGADSDCPYCTVELFIDDGDDKIEALQPVVTTAADANGDWSVDIGLTLAPTQGLRTASTTADYGQIENLEVGATSDFAASLYPSSVTPPDPTPAPTPLPPENLEMPQPLPTPVPPPTHATIITVTTTADPDTRPDYTCFTDPWGPPAPAPDGLCTLRRAIVEASSEYTPRPVLIKFNIPLTDTGYNATLEAWKITLLGDLPYVSEEQVVIDGRTQGEIGGRASGPKIIVLGGSIKLGEIAGDDNNAVYGLAVQEGQISLVTDRNIAEGNWVGLSDDGSEIHYINDDPDRDNYSYLRVGGSNNLVRNNASASAQGVSYVIAGNDNVVIGNYAGTRADGTIPDIAPHRKCHPDAILYNWFTGDGMHVSGNRNRIGGPDPADGNIFVGMLFASRDPEVTPPEAIEVHGEYNILQNNKIGVDAEGREVGVCGDGIDLYNRFNHFYDNTIVNSPMSAFGIYGSQISLDSILLESNVVKDVHEAITYGPGVPPEWKYFNPAQITGLSGTTVNGTSGADSPCPYCQVELFVDDGDSQVEALQPVAITNAGADGTWSVDIGMTLAPTQGLRTASTSRNFDVIPKFEISTTSHFASSLYPAGVTPPDPEPTPTPPLPEERPAVQWLPTPSAPGAYNTTLTVDTSEDPDTSSSYTCVGTYTGGFRPASDGKCTLRRAIVEAGRVDGANRPVLIAFNIPTGDTGYDSTLQTWKINVGSTDLAYVKGGQVFIDGRTQPGGRTTGPKIIVNGGSIKLGEIAGEDNNGVWGLAVQEGSIRCINDGNIVEANWVGLNDDGQSIYYVSNNPTYSNNSYIRAGGDNNLIKDNVSASAQGISYDIPGSDNVIAGNYVGTKADGTLPALPSGERCVLYSAGVTGWWTGRGVVIGGDRNRVSDNVIAGMMYGSGSTPPEAMDVSGSFNLVRDNRIGVDASDQDVWACGAGIILDGEHNQILDNVIANNPWYGFGMFGSIYSLNGITLRGNVVRDVPKVIEYGPGVPASLKYFAPALVTTIDGANVSGIGDDDCPYCLVDVYLDDENDATEALQHVGVATATVSGDWSLALPQALAAGQGLRTVSTVRNYGIIEHFDIGTSSKVSILFKSRPPTAIESVTIITDANDLVGGQLWVGQAINFAAQVSPFSATLPITYTWQASGLANQVVRGGVEKAVQFTWDTPGAKVVTVTALNMLGSQVDTISVNIFEPIALAEVEIDGVTSGYIDTPYTFSAVVSPANASQPITYTWQPAPSSGQGTASATYAWSVTGTHTISLTASNQGGEAKDVHTVSIASKPAGAIDPAIGGRLVYTDPVKGVTTTVDVPPYAVSALTFFTYTTVTTPAHAYDPLLFAGRAFDLDASSAISSSVGIVVSLAYREEDMSSAGISDESQLLLYYWTGTAWDDVANTCTPASTYSRDTAQNMLSVRVCHLTSFGLFGSAGPSGFKIYLPVVLKNR
ncbi:MAG: hypothetical protein JW850_00270 [Thermoflexales bacterium]|nr:hypothetical protein [Thermoflexales bacterium]